MKKPYRTIGADETNAIPLLKAEEDIAQNLLPTLGLGYAVQADQAHIKLRLISLHPKSYSTRSGNL